jgi:biopolymer transport protein ExbD
MKQKIFLDLTPLLDVVLILLFAFMLNVNVATSEKDIKIQEKNQINATLKETINDKNEHIKQLQSNIKNLNQMINKLQDNMDELSFDTANEKETIKKISNNLAKWFKDNQYKLDNITNEDSINSLIDEDSLLKQLSKYETISKKYFFIDIKLKSSSNKLFINGEDAKTFISLEEILTDDDKNNKKEQVKDIIEKVIDNREGGYTFILITLSEEDNVYRYAYTLVWEAIKDIEQKHGTDKIFKAKYVL